MIDDMDKTEIINIAEQANAELKDGISLERIAARMCMTAADLQEVLDLYWEMIISNDDNIIIIKKPH